MEPRVSIWLTCALITACGPDIPSGDAGGVTSTASSPASEGGSEASGAAEGMSDASPSDSTGHCWGGCLADFPCSGDEAECVDPFTIEIWVDVPCEEGLCLGSCWCSGGSCEHQRDEPCAEGTLCVEHGAWSTIAACLPTEGLCGGPDGLTCARGEQCEYALDLCPACLDDAAGCGPGSPLGVCVLSPDPAEVCPELDPDGDPASPQCGCDGIVYPSECDRRKAGVALGGPNACS